MHALRKWVQAEVGFIYLELDNQIKSKCFTFCFRRKYWEETKKMAESETFFIFYQVGIDCWVPTYLPAFFGRARRQRRNFLSTFKVCRIANALAHDNLIRRIKLFLTDGKKIRSVVNNKG